MAAVVRTIVYLAVIVGLVAIFLPADLLEPSGVNATYCTTASRWLPRRPVS